MLSGLNDTAENFMAAIDRDEAEVSPSSLFGAACVLEGVPFLNGSPQNTFVPGLIELAVQVPSRLSVCSILWMICSAAAPEPACRVRPARHPQCAHPFSCALGGPGCLPSPPLRLKSVLPACSCMLHLLCWGHLWP